MSSASETFFITSPFCIRAYKLRARQLYHHISRTVHPERQHTVIVAISSNYNISDIFQLPIHCETLQVPPLTPNDMPSSVPTQHSSAVVGPGTISPAQLG